MQRWVVSMVVWLACATGLAAQETISFRVRFGLTDTEARPWNGSLRVRGGDVVSLRSWRPRPDEEIDGTTAWKISSVEGTLFRNRQWEPEPDVPHRPYVKPAGLIVDLRGSDGTVVEFRTRNGSFSVAPFRLQPGTSMSFLNGAAAADRVPLVQKLSSDNSQSDFATLLAGDGGEVWTAWVAYAGWKNKVLARRYSGTAWEDPRTISENHDDIYWVKAGRDGGGGVWFVWSSQRNGNFDLYGRRWADGAWSAIERLTEAPQPDIHHALATDAKGNLWVVWQGFRNGRSNIYSRSYDGETWSGEQQVSFSAANDWEPAVATDARGKVYVAWDTYDKGNYDVRMSVLDNGAWSDPIPVAETPKFEAHVSLACDRDGRLWAAWNESGTRWGKDTGFLVKVQGTALYESRWMATAVYQGGKWYEPLERIEDALPDDIRGHNDLPLLEADGQGRVWLVFRSRRPRILGVPSDAAMHRAAWEIHAMTYHGDSWLAPIAVPSSQGRTDMRMGVDAAPGGSLHVAWPTDNRNYEDFLFDQGDVYVACVPGYPSEPARPALRERPEDKWHTYPIHPNEEADLRRIRGYTVASGGQHYRIYRGDTHRHTEFSHDGFNDGSLIDTYRYAIDAAGLDYLMVSEHNSSGGPDIEYINWLLQQMCDVLMVDRKFIPLYGYERSLSFPNGHRNVIFAKRGNPTLPIPPEEAKGIVGAGPLYEYLKKFNGISIPHTPATGMGTDWRDNDPEVEPLVEIFQGDRVSAEYEGAPKAAYGGTPTTQSGGFRREGYVWNAWAKGYKLGVQASSDHLSTHYSYAATIAEEFTRDGLLDAMKRRHSYATTDNIILDYRLLTNGREYLQGDILETSRDFRLSVKVIGTAPIQQIDIIKDNTFLHTRQKMAADAEFTFADTDAGAGEHYYYVRVQQVNGQIAWSSPIWVTVR